MPESSAHAAAIAASNEEAEARGRDEPAVASRGDRRGGVVRGTPCHRHRHPAPALRGGVVRLAARASSCSSSDRPAPAAAAAEHGRDRRAAGPEHGRHFAAGTHTDSDRSPDSSRRAAQRCDAA